MDPYFNRPEVSNSDLTSLKKYFMDQDQIRDTYDAYRFGTLVDAIITEPSKVDYFKRVIQGHDYTYTQDEFDTAKAMLKSARENNLVSSLILQSAMQKVMVKQDFQIEHDGIAFSMNVRAKWDLFINAFGWGGDIKSTTATTQKQFVEACYYFDYTRQRAWYMDIADAKQDILIGISKKNFKVFLLPIKRGDDFYNHGKKQYQELAFKYWTLFSNINIRAVGGEINGPQIEGREPGTGPQCPGLLLQNTIN